MKTKYLIPIILIILSYNQNCNAFEGLLFKPLTANTFEPRVGSLYEFQAKKLRLDIGASVDLYELYKKDSTEIRLGTDFFTYTRLRSVGKMKFPVETSDYFFGINSSMKTKIFNEDVFVRLRLAHISSHLVDGFSKDGTFNKMPYVYSREFVDIAIARDIKNFRPYIGGIFVFSTIPKNVNVFNPQIGFDYHHPVFNFLDITCGYDFKLTGTDNIYNGSNSFQAGMLLKTNGNFGVGINYYYYAGKSIHGLFFMDRDEYSAIGFQVNFY
jgi:hypothetical protein